MASTSSTVEMCPACRLFPSFDKVRIRRFGNICEYCLDTQLYEFGLTIESFIKATDFCIFQAQCHNRARWICQSYQFAVCDDCHVRCCLSWDQCDICVPKPLFPIEKEAPCTRCYQIQGEFNVESDKVCHRCYDIDMQLDLQSPDNDQDDSEDDGDNNNNNNNSNDNDNNDNNDNSDNYDNYDNYDDNTSNNEFTEAEINNPVSSDELSISDKLERMEF